MMRCGKWILVLACVGLVGCTAGRVSVPGKASISITTIDKDYLRVVREFQPLAEALSKELGQPVTVKTEWDLQQLNGHMAGQADYCDLVYLDPVEYCKLSENHSLTPVAVRINVLENTSEVGLIVVPKNSPIKTVADLKGKRFVFGPYGSPYMFYNVLELFKSGGMPTSMLKMAFYVNDSLTVAQRVVFKWADAGVVTQTWWQTTKDRGLDMRKLLKDDLRVIGQTEPLPEYIWATTGRVDSAKRQEITKLLTEKLASNPRVFTPFGAHGLAPIQEKEVLDVCQRIENIKNLPSRSLISGP